MLQSYKVQKTQRLWLYTIIGLIIFACLPVKSNARAIDTDLADEYTRAIAKNPKDATSYYKRGCFYLKTYTWKAVNDLSEAIRLNPNYLAAYIARGEAYSKEVQREKAIADFSKAISLDHNNASLYCKRANVFYDNFAYDYNEKTKGNASKAIVDYSAAIKIDPENAEYRHRRGVAYEHMHEFQNAIDDFCLELKVDTRTGKTMDKDSQDDIARSYGGLALQYLVNKQYDQAIDKFSKAIGLNAEDAGNYNFRGIAYEESGQPQRAMNDFDLAWKIEVDHQYGYINQYYVGFRPGLLGAYTQLYSLREWNVNGYKYRPAKYNSIEIVHGNKQVFSGGNGFGYGHWLSIPFEGVKKRAGTGKLPCWDFSQLKPAKSPAIRLNESLPPMFVIAYSEVGDFNRLPTKYELFALGKEFKKITELNSSDPYTPSGANDFYFVDFYGNGDYVAVGFDGIDASAQVPIILRLDNNKFVLAEDLMKNPPPDDQFISELAKQTKTEFTSPKGSIYVTPLESHILSNMTQLVLSGNGDFAWKYLDKVWPDDKVSLFNNYHDNKPVTKAQFIKDFKDGLSASPYWSSLKHLNGW